MSLSVEERIAMRLGQLIIEGEARQRALEEAQAKEAEAEARATAAERALSEMRAP